MILLLLFIDLSLGALQRQQFDVCPVCSFNNNCNDYCHCGAAYAVGQSYPNDAVSMESQCLQWCNAATFAHCAPPSCQSTLDMCLNMCNMGGGADKRGMMMTCAQRCQNAYATCTGTAGCSVSINGATQNVPNGRCADLFSSNTVPCGSTCSSQHRCCTNGAASGDPSFQWTTCSTEACTAPPTCTPMQGTLSTWGPCSVPCGGGTQSRTCDWASCGGNCNGAALSQACNTQACSTPLPEFSCTERGCTNGINITEHYYLCSDGTLACCPATGWDCTYNGPAGSGQAFCQRNECKPCVVPASPCIVNGVSYPSGTVKTLYDRPCGTTCTSQDFTCTNGVVSPGSFGSTIYAACSPLPVVQGTLSSWGACSSTCGGGTQTRTCTGSSCGGNCNRATLSQSCNTHACITTAPPNPCDVAEEACLNACPMTMMPGGGGDRKRTYGGSPGVVYTCQDICHITRYWCMQGMTPPPPASCIVNGITYAHGFSIRLYDRPCGGSCYSQVFTCNNGVVSPSSFGNTTYRECDPLPIVQGTLSSWSTCSVTCGGGTQTRTCTGSSCGGNCNGAVLSQSCNTHACTTIPPPSNCTGTVGSQQYNVESGYTITLYDRPCGNPANPQCASQVFTCTNGVVSPSSFGNTIWGRCVNSECTGAPTQRSDVYTKHPTKAPTQAPTAPRPCTVNGNSYPSGFSIELYDRPCGGTTCLCRNFTCTDGLVYPPSFGNTTYRQCDPITPVDSYLSEWSACSVSCGGGMQTRTCSGCNVNCGDCTCGGAILTRWCNEHACTSPPTVPQTKPPTVPPTRSDIYTAQPTRSPSVSPTRPPTLSDIYTAHPTRSPTAPPLSCIIAGTHCSHNARIRLYDKPCGNVSCSSRIFTCINGIVTPHSYGNTTFLTCEPTVPIDSVLSAWTPCSAPCGGGTKTRTCTGCNATCGDCTCGGALLTKSCNTHDCPTNAPTAAPCSVRGQVYPDGFSITLYDRPCGGTTCAEQLFTCVDGNVVPAGFGSTIYRNCIPTVPINSVLSTWEPCSAPCGGGIQTRTCTGCNTTCGDCTCGGAMLSQMCNTQCCPIQGILSNWTNCPVSCGGGIQTRTCTGNSCGGNCSGASLTRRCNTIPCTTVAPPTAPPTATPTQPPDLVIPEQPGGACQQNCIIISDTRIYSAGIISGCLYVTATADVTFIGDLTLSPPCALTIECGARITVAGQLFVNQGASVTPIVSTFPGGGIRVAACPLITGGSVGSVILPVNPPVATFPGAECYTLSTAGQATSTSSGLAAIINLAYICTNGISTGAIVAIIIIISLIMLVAICFLMPGSRRRRRRREETIPLFQGELVSAHQKAH